MMDCSLQLGTLVQLNLSQLSYSLVLPEPDPHDTDDILRSWVRAQGQTATAIWKSCELDISVSRNHNQGSNNLGF